MKKTLTGLWKPQYVGVLANSVPPLQALQSCCCPPLSPHPFLSPSLSLCQTGPRLPLCPSLPPFRSFPACLMEQGSLHINNMGRLISNFIWCPLHGVPPAGSGECGRVGLVTWLWGTRCVVIAGFGGGRGGLHGRRGGPGGGFVYDDLRLELWKAPPPVDVLKLLDLDTKHSAWQAWHTLTLPNPTLFKLTTHMLCSPGSKSYIPPGIDSRSGCQQVSTSWTENWIGDVWINPSKLAGVTRTSFKMSWLISSLEKDVWHFI